MSYWITTHWPRRRDEPASGPYSGVWVKENQWHIIEELAPGDLVFIYESVSGPTIIKKEAGGTESRLSRQPGRGGIVALVQITERASQPPGSQPQEYSDGTSAWWRYCAPTRSLNSGGFIPMEEANQLLGYRETYNFHGFGDEHSGVKKISPEVFERLYEAFRTASIKADERMKSSGRFNV